MMAARSTMSGVSLAVLLDGLVGAEQVPALEVQGLAADSRVVRDGDLFLASQGLQVHGLAFASQAVKQGAVAVLWEPTDDAFLIQQAAALQAVDQVLQERLSPDDVQRLPKEAPGAHPGLNDPARFH